MDILYDIGVSKLLAKVFSKVNYSFKEFMIGSLWQLTLTDGVFSFSFL